jgi:hypothetical protein
MYSSFTGDFSDDVSYHHPFPFQQKNLGHKKGHMPGMFWIDEFPWSSCQLILGLCSTGEAGGIFASW